MQACVRHACSGGGHTMRKLLFAVILALIAMIAFSPPGLAPTNDVLMEMIQVDNVLELDIDSVAMIAAEVQERSPRITNSPATVFLNVTYSMIDASPHDV